MAIRVDLTGRKFNMLTVVQELGGNKVLCKCDCGNEKVINKDNVKSGKVMSCGCLLRKKADSASTYRKTPLASGLAILLFWKNWARAAYSANAIAAKLKTSTKGTC